MKQSEENKVPAYEIGKPAVVLQDLVKEYSIARSGKSLLKQILLPSYTGEVYRALDHINATFNYGERVGLLGINGSGKSTLSSIISGISYPTDGVCQVNGSVSMLNTNVGLNANLTGRESIHYKCLLLGFTERQIQEMEKSIIDFADIGIYIDQPLRTYSSGMKARLGFAISSQLRPDILVVDEALSVGDAGFADKCKDWMMDFSAQGHCCVFVSHSINTMRTFCEKILWIHRGKQIVFGDAGDILDAYAIYSRSIKRMSAAQKRATTPNFNALMQQVEAERIEKNT